MIAIQIYLTSMLNFFRSIFKEKPRGSHDTGLATSQPQACLAWDTDARIEANGVQGFALAAHLRVENGFPILDWTCARAWADSIESDQDRRGARLRVERAWLEEMRNALGSAYSLHENDEAIILSSLEPNVAKAMLGNFSNTRQGVIQALDGVADDLARGKQAMIVFGDEDSYYRYVSHYHNLDDEFLPAGAMHINSGFRHFIALKSDLRQLESIISDGLIRMCIGHIGGSGQIRSLPMPAWLHEGIFLATQQRLSAPGRPQTPAQQQMHARHLAFWGECEIQEFWAGDSFLRADDGSALSYDLARLVVAQLSQDWPRFRSFVLDASAADAGAASASAHLQRDLGQAVAEILERQSAGAYAPAPDTWPEDPGRGAF